MTMHLKLSAIIKGIAYFFCGACLVISCSLEKSKGCYTLEDTVYINRFPKEIKTILHVPYSLIPKSNNMREKGLINYEEYQGTLEADPVIGPWQ